MRLLGVILVAGLLLAVGQMAAVLLTLALLLLFGWAVCFRTRQLLSVLAFLLAASLLTAHPGWFAVFFSLVAFLRWLEVGKPSIPEIKLLPPPNSDQPHC